MSNDRDRWSSLRRSFSLRHIGVTILALASMTVATVLAIMRIMGRLNDGHALTAIVSVLAALALSEGILRVVTLVRIEDNLAGIASGFGDKSDLNRLDDLTPVDDFIADATDVLMVGLTKVGFLGQRSNFVKQMLQEGCTVRMLMLDPNSPGFYRYVANNLAVSEERFLADISQSQRTIADLRSSLSPEESERLQVRLCSVSPGAGITLVDSAKRAGRLQVYFFSYRADPRERPALELSKSEDPVWYDYFQRSYEKLWRDSAPPAPAG